MAQPLDLRLRIDGETRAGEVLEFLRVASPPESKARPRCLLCKIAALSPVFRRSWLERRQKPCPEPAHTIRCWAGLHHCCAAWREKEKPFEGNHEPCSDSIALHPGRRDRCDVAGISGTCPGSMDGRCPCFPERR